MAGGKVLGGGAATLAIARVTWTRAMRTRTLVGAILVAALPLIMAGIFAGMGRSAWRGVFEMSELTAAVLVALLVAGPIGEEFEERTMTYLWSRPLPRWSVVTGKSLALVPLAAILGAGLLGLALGVARIDSDARVGAGEVAAALGLGIVARASIAAALATLVPKQALALTIAYLFFFDLPLAVIPARLQSVSIVFHESQIARVERDTSATTGIVGLAAITVAFLALALWRVRRIE